MTNLIENLRIVEQWHHLSKNFIFNFKYRSSLSYPHFSYKLISIFSHKLSTPKLGVDKMPSA